MHKNCQTCSGLWGEEGSVYLQFLISSLIFLFYLIWTVDFSRMLYQNHVVLFTVNEIGREAATWNISGATPAQMAADIVAKTKAKAASLGLQLADSDIQVCPSTSVTGTTCSVTTIGKPNYYFLLRVERKTPVLLNLLNLPIGAAAVLRLEPNPRAANTAPGNPGPPPYSNS